LETLEGDSAKVDMGEVGSSDAVFGGATFTGNAYFQETTFTGDAYFIGETFIGDAVFDGATFTADAFGATFGRPPAFDNALFKKGVPASVAHYRSAEGTDEQA
jgi:hypothetical protein